MKWIWIGVMIALFLSELVSLKFTSIWFFFSAIISYILFRFDVAYAYQVLAFILVGLFLILVIRPRVIDKLEKKRDIIISKILNKVPFFKHFISKDLLPVIDNKKDKNINKKKSKKK
jgi:membrane protein implicated in regulation of membrane protease activity